jgi:hypothetical protein
MTRQAHCRRWADLTDAHALGTPLGPQDAAFVSRHARDCALCGREASLYAALERWEEDEPSAPPAQEQTATPVVESRRGTYARGAALALAGIAAGVLVWLGTRTRETVTAPAAEEPGRVRVVAASGEGVGVLAASRDDVPDGAVISVPTGRLCVRFDEDATACFGDRASARIHGADRNARRVELLGGSVAVDVVPHKRRPFQVVTPRGTVDVVGTVFTVHTDGNLASVGVSHGIVRATDSKQRTVEVSGGRWFDFGSDQTRTYGTAEHDLDRRLLQGAQLWESGPQSAMFIPAAPFMCEVEVDGVGVGSPPLWLRVAPGKRSVSLSTGPLGCAAQAQEKELASNNEWTITWAAPKAAPSATAAVPTPSASTGGDAASLMREAQAMRAAGRGNEARRLYQEITTRYPSSAEAQAVRISLGQLELGAGNADRALKSFDAYLATGGALAQEAQLGRIAALRALGRSKDELAAIDAFLATYPGSMHADGLKTRRAEIAAP